MHEQSSLSIAQMYRQAEQFLLFDCRHGRGVYHQDGLGLSQPCSCSLFAFAGFDADHLLKTANAGWLWT